MSQPSHGKPFSNAVDKVESCDFCGVPGVRLRNNEVELIVVPDWGSNAVSLRYLPKDLNILRSPDSLESYNIKPVLYGIPVLFPPNRIEDGTFEYVGRTYHFDINEPKSHNHIHGFVGNVPWNVVATRESEEGLGLTTRIRSQDHPDILRQFPHRFTLDMTYLLQGSKLVITATLKNEDPAPIPYGLGYHTTFNFPFSKQGSLENCAVELTVDSQWKLNDRLLPTGELVESEQVGEFKRGMSLVGKELDHAFLSRSAGASNHATLYDRDSQIRVDYRTDDNFKHWVVYNADSQQGFVCPEPYTWITNAPNLNLSPELTGFAVLEPGATKNMVTEIEITDCN